MSDEITTGTLRTKRWLWYVGIALGLAAAFGIWRWRIHVAVEREVAWFRAAGYPVTAVELDAWYAQVPDADNAANIVLQAGSQISGSFSTSNQNWFSASSLARMDLPDYAPQLVKDNAAVIELLHTIRSRSAARYPINLRLGTGTLVPHLLTVRHEIWLLAMDALVAIENGDRNRCLVSMESSTGVANSLSHEPLVISQLVRASCLSASAKVVERALNRLEFTGEELVNLMRALDQTRLGDALARALAGEAASTLEIFDDPRPLYSSYNGISGSPPNSFASSLQGIAITAGQASGYIEADKEFYLHEMAGLISAAREARTNGFGRYRDTADSGYETMTQHRILYVLSSMLLPFLSSAGEKVAAASAAIELAQSACAIERFRIANQGHLPQTLAELVPGILPAMPTDPFDGKPLRYQRRQKGFILYSIGPDLKDDGGIERQYKTGGGVLDATAPYDLMFTVER